MTREQLLKTLAARMWSLLEQYERGELTDHELYVRRSQVFLQVEQAGIARELTCVLTSQRTDRQHEREQWAHEWALRGGGVHGLVAA